MAADPGQQRQPGRPPRSRPRRSASTVRRRARRDLGEQPGQQVPAGGSPGPSSVTSSAATAPSRAGNVAQLGHRLPGSAGTGPGAPRTGAAALVQRVEQVGGIVEGVLGVLGRDRIDPGAGRPAVAGIGILARIGASLGHSHLGQREFQRAQRVMGARLHVPSAIPNRSARLPNRRPTIEHLHQHGPVLGLSCCSASDHQPGLHQGVRCDRLRPVRAGRPPAAPGGRCVIATRRSRSGAPPCTASRAPRRPARRLKTGLSGCFQARSRVSCTTSSAACRSPPVSRTAKAHSAAACSSCSALHQVAARRPRCARLAFASFRSGRTGRGSLVAGQLFQRWRGAGSLWPVNRSAPADVPIHAMTQ